MPNKHFYFAMGAASGTIITWAIRKSRFWLLENTRWMKKLYRWNRHWFLYFPFIIAICGVFAWIPDILHALEILPKDVTRGSIFNIFFLHSFFERIENQNPQVDQILNWIGEIILFCISIGILLYYALHLNKLISQNKKK